MDGETRIAPASGADPPDAGNTAVERRPPEPPGPGAIRRFFRQPGAREPPPLETAPAAHSGYLHLPGMDHGGRPCAVARHGGEQPAKAPPPPAAEVRTTGTPASREQEPPRAGIPRRRRLTRSPSARSRSSGSQGPTGRAMVKRASHGQTRREPWSKRGFAEKAMANSRIPACFFRISTSSRFRAVSGSYQQYPAVAGLNPAIPTALSRLSIPEPVSRRSWNRFSTIPVRNPISGREPWSSRTEPWSIGLARVIW